MSPSIRLVRIAPTLWVYERYEPDHDGRTDWQPIAVLTYAEATRVKYLLSDAALR